MLDVIGPLGTLLLGTLGTPSAMCELGCAGYIRYTTGTVCITKHTGTPITQSTLSTLISTPSTFGIN